MMEKNKTPLIKNTIKTKNSDVLCRTANKIAFSSGTVRDNLKNLKTRSGWKDTATIRTVNAFGVRALKMFWICRA